MGPYAMHLEDVLALALQLRSDSYYLHTTVVKPSEGAVLTGVQDLDATAPDITTVTRVQFYLSGGALRGSSLIATASLGLEGWLGDWDSASVPNGKYRLQSVAYNDTGNVTRSADVVIWVKN